MNKVYAIHEADGQDVTMIEETAYSLVTAGGKPGQGYPAVLVCIEGNGSRPSHQGDGFKESQTMYTLNTTEVHSVAYGISSYDSNAFKSSNPHSGIYEAVTARTLDLNGGNPSCNQGGTCVVQVYDARGNGDGTTVPTLTGDHENRITDYTAIAVEVKDD